MQTPARAHGGTHRMVQSTDTSGVAQYGCVRRRHDAAGGDARAVSERVVGRGETRHAGYCLCVSNEILRMNK